ncbi:MAG: N-methyl-L-tryptophan oxidase [Phycisphaerae bacterium]|nr:N-methyl-L-tryptophan oxidase [Phycisphaerae bacterium]
MSGDRYDVIVIGVGAMGASTCWHLARRGHRVLGLEQFGIPHDLGSSHGRSRMIRLAYYEHADYVPLLKRAYALWRELEGESGRQVLFPCGGLYMGPASGEFVRKSAEAADRYGLAYERLEADELRRRYPMFVVPGNYAAMFEPGAGYLRCEDAVSDLTAQARGHGARLHEHEAVRAWEAHGRGVSVTTEGGVYQAEKLVITAGAWSQAVVPDLGAPLSVTRQTMAWLEPTEPQLFTADRFPCWGIEDPDGAGLFYGFPPAAGKPGLKVAHHRPGEIVDASTVDRSPRSGDADPLLKLARAHLPKAAGTVLSLGVCLYTNSPDSHFIIDHHPDPATEGRVALACGFSGHGFKFTSVVGEALADLATEGSTDLPIGFLGLGRFAK